ncbi:MAG: ankyrin repeat domain-containing protein [Parachlamydiaceae bacterium]|nr:ankyrin repeat domain-containing protein [Parachlamydiaceae bacterium]
MVKMPLCRTYFSMLSVINFFSGYFSTLKKHRKIPVLPAFESMDIKGCPSIFPHLPVKKTFRETPRYNPQQIVKKWAEDYSLPYLFHHLFKLGTESVAPLSIKNIEPRWTNECVKPLSNAIYEDIISSFSPPVQRIIKKVKHKLNQDIKKISQEMSLTLANQIFEEASDWIKAYKKNQKQMDYIDLAHPFLRKIHDVFLKESRPIFTKPVVLSDTRLKSQMSFDEVEQGKRIVGGCGMDLKVQTIQSSPKASQVLRDHWSKMISLPPESWNDLGDKQNAVFRLMFEDVPAGVSDNYEWMESLLFLRNEEDPEDIENRIRIEQAILDDDSDEFFSLIDQMKNLHPDRNERTLLHFAAQVADPLYMESLISLGLSYSSKDLHGYLPIHYAAMSGSLKNLRLLLKIDSEKNLNARSHNGSTPLIVAIQHNQFAVVKLLLSYGASFHTTLEGYNPLHCALHQGDFEIISFLLRSRNVNSLCINEMGEEEGTPLMLACELDSADLIKRMIQLGADPKAKRKDGLTALEIVIKRQCVPVLEILLEHIIPSDQIFETATKESSVQVYRLLAKKKNPYHYKNSFHDTPLHIAIRNGNISIANILIASCKKVSFLQKKNLNGECAFSLACAMGLWQVINELYKKNAIKDYEPLLQIRYRPLVWKIFQKLDLTYEDLQRCLLTAVEAGNEQVILNVLIPMGANIHDLIGSNDWRIINYLAKSDGIDLFRTLIADSKDLLQPLIQEGNKTLAYIAAENGSKRILRLLLEQMKNQHCSLREHYLDRHLFYAVIEAGLLDQVQFMLDLHKEIPFLSNQILDQKRTTPAHLAAQIGSLDIMKALSEHGADLNVKNAEGFTPLDYAVRLQAEEIVIYLLEQKVQLTLQAFYLAALQNDLHILQILTQQPDCQKFIDMALIRAVRNYQTQAFLHLLQSGASLEYATKRGLTSLLIASYSGQYEVIIELLKQKSFDKRTYNQMNPLDLACQQGHTHCVGILIKAGYVLTDPNLIYTDAINVALGEPNASYQKNITTFLDALHYGDTQTMRASLEKFDLHEKICIEHKKQKINGTPIQLLLHIDKGEKFASVIRDFLTSSNENNKLKHDTEDTFNKDTYGHLLTRANLSFTLNEASTVCKNHQGQTILHLAAQYASTKFLTSILNQSDDVDVVDNHGRTALFYAIKGNKEDNLKLLIQKKANLNHYDHKRFTPLLYACKHQSILGARTLLEGGANPDLIGTKAQVAPLFLAIENESDSMALTLIVHGANCRGF